MKIITFSEPKNEESQRNNQDCFACNPEKTLIALSDGAGASLYPKQWAEMLVNHFCQSQKNPYESLKKSYQKWLKEPQKQWQQYYLQKMRDNNLKWWQKGSEVKTYAAATFLGFSLQKPTQQWQAVAIGDSCLFHLSAQTGALRVFPEKTSQGFQSITQCFMSSPDLSAFEPQFQQGNYQSEDIFLLATDALSEWILRNYEEHRQDWQKCV